MEKKETKIFIVRHGETFAKTSQNELGMPFVCGSGSEISRNIHLTPNGKMQMEKNGGNYRDVKFDICIISDLIRSRETAEAFLKGAVQEGAETLVDPRVTEINYGEDDGISEDIVKQKKKTFFADETKTAEEYDLSRGGETFFQAGIRMRDAIKDISEKYPEKKILIISHSGSMRAFTGNIIPGQDLKFGEVLKVGVHGDEFIFE